MAEHDKGFKWPARDRGQMDAPAQKTLVQFDARLKELRIELEEIEKARERFLYGAPLIMWFQVAAYPWPNRARYAYDDYSATVEPGPAVLAHVRYDADIVQVIASFLKTEHARGDWSSPPRAEWSKPDKVWAIKPDLWVSLAELLVQRCDPAIQEIAPPAYFLDKYDG